METVCGLEESFNDQRNADSGGNFIQQTRLYYHNERSLFRAASTWIGEDVKLADHSNPGILRRTRRPFRLSGYMTRAIYGFLSASAGFFVFRFAFSTHLPAFAKD